MLAAPRKLTLRLTSGGDSVPFAFFLKILHLFMNYAKTLIFLPFLAWPRQGLASAWNVEEGTYKCYFSTALLDPASRRLRNEKLEEYEKTTKMLDAMLKAEIVHKGASDSKTKENQKIIQALERDIKNLKAYLSELEGYNDTGFNTASLEYGISHNKSIGTKVTHKINKLGTAKYGAIHSSSIVQSGEVFFKYQIFKNDTYAASLQPKTIISRYKDDPVELFGEISLMFGRSKRKRKTAKNIIQKTFLEFQISYGHNLLRKGSDKFYNAFAISEGVEIPFGITISNYSRYIVRKTDNPVYKMTLYDQLSIAKAFKIRKQTLNFQIGYFWDRSLKYRRYKISGPIFSIFFDI